MASVRLVSSVMARVKLVSSVMDSVKAAESEAVLIRVRLRSRVSVMGEDSVSDRA